MPTSKGFTLVELLVVIAIVAILASFGLVLFNGVQAKGRDAARLSDMSNIAQAIMLTTSNSSNLAPELCFNQTLPCDGDSYPLDASTQKTTGEGWVKVNFDAKNTANFSVIPVDPINKPPYYYHYQFDGTNWHIWAVLEASENKDRMLKDGGVDPDKYELFSKF